MLAPKIASIDTALQRLNLKARLFNFDISLNLVYFSLYLTNYYLINY
jgi:hypothetical protein